MSVALIPLIGDALALISTKLWQSRADAGRFVAFTSQGQSMADLTASALGDALTDRYRLERELGQGGMATVYLAHDLKHDRDVALKMLRPELGAVLGTERFLREIRLTAKLQHPHILPLLDSGEAAGRLFYVMPYVEGESLRRRLQREGQLRLEDALRVTGEVAEALDYAHQQGVIHRDVKPENILLSRGHAVVADFGIALAVTHAGGGRLTETGLSLGTPAYMSPEQATAEPRLDGRSDQYSLACVLYEILAGEPPYTGPTAQAIVAKRLSEPVPHLATLRQVPPAVEAAVTRALARSPADRFATTADFMNALSSARDAAPTESPRGAKARNVAIAVALVAAALAVGSLLFARRTPGSAGPTTIAVLPVRDLDLGDTSAFAAGLTEDLGTAAATIPGLFVVSSRSAATARRESDDPRTLGRRLGVSALLEATVRTSGDKLRVVARLVRAKDGGVIWSNAYDRSRRDVLSIQDELAASVADALRLRLAPGAASDRAASPARLVEPAAYDLYARAVQLHQRQRSAADQLTAAALLDSAIRVDPGFGRAYGELAFVLLNQVDYGEPYERVWPALNRAVARGLAVDPDDARTLAVASILAGKQRRWDSAQALAQRAIARAPGDAQVRGVNAGRLTDLLDLPTAHHETQLALQLAPLDVFAVGTTAWNLVRLGEHREAIQAVEGAIALDSNIAFHYVTRGMAQACQGQWDRAFADLNRGQVGFFPLAMLGVAQALHGDTTAALDVLRRLEALEHRGEALPVSVAWIYAFLRQSDSAFAWLERAESTGNPYTGIADFLFDDLVSDPRWLQWARRDIGDSAAAVARQVLLAHPRCRPR